MLLQLYILFAVFAIICMLVALVMFSIYSFTALDSGVAGSGNSSAFQKLGTPLILSFIAVVIFSICSVTAMNIETQHCENQVTEKIIDNNTTTYSNEIGCDTNIYSNPALAYSFGGLAALNALMIFIYATVYLIGE